MITKTLKPDKKNVLKSSRLETELGSMLVIADENALYLLEFANRRHLEQEIERLKKKTGMSVVPGRTKAIDSIEAELKQYFAGKLHTFKTPFTFLGSPFQKSVWKALEEIPHGKTSSYAQVAALLKKPSAFRAVANAVGSNNLALIIPCHRVINKDGRMGGYAAGLERKKWLLKHESVGV